MTRSAGIRVAIGGMANSNLAAPAKKVCKKSARFHRGSVGRPKIVKPVRGNAAASYTAVRTTICHVTIRRALVRQRRVQQPATSDKVVQRGAQLAALVA
jgi:hypothetical protein